MFGAHKMVAAVYSAMAFNDWVIATGLAIDAQAAGAAQPGFQCQIKILDEDFPHVLLNPFIKYGYPESAILSTSDGKFRIPRRRSGDGDELHESHTQLFQEIIDLHTGMVIQRVDACEGVEFDASCL